MQNQSIISKGKYGYPQTEGIVSLKHYFFVRDEKGQKRLLLRFFNERKEACTKFAFVIRFLDSRGKVIDEERFETANIKMNGRKSYTFDEAIFVNEICTTFKVEVLYASYGNYKYTNEGDSVAIEYEKPETVVAKSKRAPKHTNAPRKIKVRSFKLSWVYMAFALVLLTVAISVISAQLYLYKAIEDEFTLDGVEYEFVSKTEGTVRITGTTGTYKNVLIPSEIEGYRVVEIKDNAFFGDRNIQKVLIDGVDVGENTFANCPNLTEVEITSISNIGKRAFANCPKLKKINISYPDEFSDIGEVLPKPTLQIEERAFANCTSLEYVSIDQIANYTTSCKIFENDAAVKELYLKNFAYIDKTVKDRYGNEVKSQETSLLNMFNPYYYGTISLQLEKIRIDYIDNIPASFCQDFTSLQSFEVTESPVSTVGRSAFDGCVSLTSLSFNFPVRIIEDRAFANTKITSFNANEISSIGKEAFLNCKELSQFSLTGNNTIKSIGDRAFQNCTSITSIVLPATLTELGKGALQNTSIKSFKYTNNDLEIRQGALNGCYLITELDLAEIPAAGIGYLFIDPNDSFITDSSPEYIINTYTSELSKVKNLVKISLSGKATEVTKMAFAGCENLQAISLPIGITSIEEYAFANCKKLVDINVGPSVESIGKYAFENTGITAFVLPKSMTVIPEGMLYNCESLVSVTLHEDLVEIGNEAFRNCKSLTSIDLLNTKIINDYAFADTGLTSIVIPSNAEYIGYTILRNCNSIREITLPLLEDNRQVSSYFVSYWDYGASVPSSIEKVTINAGETLYSDTFYDVYSVEEIVIENGIVVIEQGAFVGLSELRRLTIPESVLVFDVSNIDSAYRLYEICNLSQVNLNINDLPNTLYISTSIDDVAPHAYSDGYEYAYYGDSWYLVNWDNDITNVNPAYDFTYAPTENEIQSVSEWKIPPSLFRETSLSAITLPSSVVEIGANAFYSCGSNSIVLDYYMPLTEIEDGMFKNCSLLTSIYLPYSVEAIGNNAFENCSRLTSISLPTNVYTIGVSAFENCSALTSVEFSPNLTSIDARAFYGCISLSDVEIDCVETIGESAFYNCYALTKLYLEYVEEISEKAFYNCYLLNAVVLPDSLTSLGQSAFEECSSLSSVVLSSSLDEIKSNTFLNCSSLEEIVIPNSIKKIGDCAFYGCSSLRCVTLGTGLEEMSNDAFAYDYDIYDIYNLSSISVEEGSTDYYGFARKAFVHTSLDEPRSASATVTGFGNIRYCGSEWVVFSIDNSIKSFNTDELSYSSVTPTEIRFLETSTGGNYGYSSSSLESIVFGDNVTQIHSYAFSYLNYLKAIDFSQNTKLTRLESNTFEGCQRLMELTLPQNVEEIGSCAFYNCTKLLSVTLPEKLETIGSEAFYGCEQLLEVYDLTPYIYVEKSDYYNGCVAYYAKAVFTSSAQSLERIELDGFYFVKYNTTYYLHHYVGDMQDILTIPETGYDIVILANAFEGSNASKTVISESVTVIYADTYNYSVLEDSYYKGNRSEWNSVYVSGYGLYPRYYGDCVHDSNEWTYVDGVISTSYCELEWKETTAPTCYSYGEKTGRCKCSGCAYYETESVSMVPHNFVDGVCEYCDREYRVITPENMDDYEEIFTMEIYGYTMDEEGKITTSASVGDTVRVYLTANETIELSYEGTVSGGSNSLRIYDDLYYYSTVRIYSGQTYSRQIVLYEGDTLVFEYVIQENSSATINYIKVLLD